VCAVYVCMYYVGLCSLCVLALAFIDTRVLFISVLFELFQSVSHDSVIRQCVVSV